MKQNKNTPSQAPTPEETHIRSAKRYDIIVKVLCVFAAFVLWVYVMHVESPEYTEEINLIEVELTGTEVLESQRGLSIYSGKGQFINITVSGKKSDIQKMQPEEIMATVDVSSITEAGRHPVDISIDLPGGLALVSKSQDTITVYVDENITKTVPVRQNILNMNLPAGYEVGTITMEYDSINVTGPKNYVNNVAEARVDIDLGGQTRSFSMKGEVYLVDSFSDTINNNYLKYTTNVMAVDVPIYTTVTVPVEVSFQHGFLNAENAQIRVTPSEVTIKGDESAMDVEQLLEPIVLDEKKIVGNSYIASMTLRTADGTFIEDNENEVQIQVEIDPSIKSMPMTVTDIQVTGADAISYQIIDEGLEVTLQGPVEKLKKIRPSDVYIMIDLSGFSSNSSGMVTKTAKIVVDAEDAEGIYEIGEYRVRVQIN